jgi:opacity protein-like surface antigen
MLSVTGLPTSISASEKLDGVIGAVQIGYNWQTNKTQVLGFEADFQGSDENNSSNFSDQYRICVSLCALALQPKAYPVVHKKSEQIKQRGATMPRFVLVAGVILLMADYSFAQSDPNPMQCQQIRQAVAQYGFAAARQHALATYGPEAVKTGDKCFATQRGRGRVHAARHQK